MTLNPDNAQNKGYVFLIEDDVHVRESLATMLRFLNYRVHAYASAQAYLQEDLMAGPAVIVCDMRMPGMTGVQLQQHLLARKRMLPMVFISGESTSSQIIQALKQGAVDFLLKPFEREDLLRAIAEGLERDQRAIVQMHKRSVFDAGLQKLSPRERSVFELLSEGANNAEIQQALGIALPTAKQYKSEVMSKLGLKSLSELIRLHRQMASDNTPAPDQ